MRKLSGRWMARRRAPDLDPVGQRRRRPDHRRDPGLRHVQRRAVVLDRAHFMNGGAGGLSVADAFNLNSEYSTAAYGGNFGLFGGMAERQSMFAPLSLTAWNMGGSLGYGGFYLRAGVNTTPQLGPLQQTQGWQAGLGFATGPVDFRVTYMMAQTGGFGAQERELDSQQFSLGGFYRLTSSLRLNADAFLGMHDSRTGRLLHRSRRPERQPPQGTGARVGIQLRF